MTDAHTRHDLRAAATAVALLTSFVLAALPAGARAAEPCVPGLISGISVSACTNGDPGPARLRVTTRDGRTRQVAFERDEGVWSATMPHSALEPGDEAALSGPLPAGTRIILLAEGPGYAPYVVAADVPEQPAGATWTVRLVRSGDDLAVQSTTPARLQPGLRLGIPGAVALRVRDRRAELHVFGPSLAGLRFKTLEDEDDVRGRRVLLGPGTRLPSGYRVYRFRVPRGTEWVVGYRGRVAEERTIRLMAEANVRVQVVGGPRLAREPVR